jgi:hypothetical protein
LVFMWHVLRHIFSVFFYNQCGVFAYQKLCHMAYFNVKMNLDEFYKTMG